MLLEGRPGEASRLDHLGVEVTDAAAVQAATRRLVGAGMPTATEEATTCCYAVQDKVWVSAPGEERWEVYTVLADAQPELEGVTAGAGPCCGAAVR